LRLDPLGPDNAAELLTAMIGDAAALGPLKATIIERTQGNPFFMEEMVQVLLDEGALVRNGVVKLTKPIAELKTPTTVQGILAARIDRLAAGAKDLLQTLAVIGREFPISLVRTVVLSSDDELARTLNDLQLGEFIYEQPAVGDTEYTFKHALTQEVAYNSVLIERRKALHERIGGALEVQYASSLEDHLAELAHHYTRSANNDKAVTFLALAGWQAFGRYAYAESRTQFSEGLQLIARLPASPQRDIRESELASALAGACWRLHGVDAPETAEAVLRASGLAEKTGNLAELINELFLHRVIISRAGDFAGASALANRLLELAELEGSAASFDYAYNATVQARFAEGDLAGAETQFALWRNYRDATSSGDPLRERTTVVLATAADCAWVMGRIYLARERMAEATAYAAALKEPFPLMIAKWCESQLYFLIREPEQALAAASQSIALSEDNGIRLEPENIATKAWALAHLGNPAEGLALLDAQLHDRAVRLRGSYLVIHAEVRAMAGRYDAAMESVESVLSVQQQNSYRPEHLRVRGEIRIKLTQPEAAEADFREAIALAQKMGARSWELRATTSLARLLRDTGRHDEARAMLSDIYNWFTEGFDTADLKDAKTLLEDLAG
jgi:tetratricopeptide (TPR) repeat protein